MIAFPTRSLATDIDDVDTASSNPTHTLRRGLVVWVTFIALGLAGALVWTGFRAASEYFSAQGNTRLRDAAVRGQLLVDRALLERVRQAELIGAGPAVVDAAREGARRAASMGLVGRSIEVNERDLAKTRSLDVSDRARRYLREQLEPLGVAEMIVTDVNGFNAVTTEMTSDFVQSDENWWKQAFQDGLTKAEAQYDESAQQVVVSLAAAVRESGRDRPDGVLKIGFGIRALDDALARAAADGVELEVLDMQGRVIASSGTTPRLRALPGVAGLPATGDGSLVNVDGPNGAARAVVLGSNDGAWRVVAHVEERVIFEPLTRAQPYLLGGLVVLLVVMGGMIWTVSRFIERRITTPVTELAVVAEAVAGGDLSVTYEPSAVNDEVGRLSRGIAAMIDDLRRLATALREASQETKARAAEITGGSENMAGAAQQMAMTSGELSRQSAEMADTIQYMSADSARLMSIANELAEGARDGVARNARLNTLAAENRSRFDVGATALEALATDTRSNADAVAALASASEDFGAFVTLVQRMAKQSKLLALNAAMEAARAGEHGQGFAVVASEVRRLATTSAEAAETTSSLMHEVLEKVRASRASSARTMATVNEVLDTTRLGRESFSQVESAVHDAETWTVSIDEASGRSRALVGELNARLEELTKATESYAAAMEEVAASSEEQSASTEEIASAAASVGDSATRLSELVATFRLEASATTEAGATPPTAASDATLNGPAAAPPKTFAPWLAPA